MKTKTKPEPPVVATTPPLLVLPTEWSVGNQSYRASEHPLGYALRTYLGGRMRRMDVYLDMDELREAIQETRRQ